MKSTASSTSVIRICVVEDDEHIRSMLIVLLEGTTGFRCVGAYASAELAMEDIPNKLPDLVLMDINLPGKSGIECVAFLRAKCPQVHCVMLTVFEDPDRIFEALRAGAVGYLLKSTPPVQIMAALQDAFEGGAPMSAQIARKVVQSFRPNVQKTTSLDELTEREREILSMLSSGYQYKEIAKQLSISMDTVKTHVRHIYEKLQVRNRSEATLILLGK